MLVLVVFELIDLVTFLCLDWYNLFTIELTSSFDFVGLFDSSFLLSSFSLALILFVILFPRKFFKFKLILFLPFYLDSLDIMFMILSSLD